MWRNRSSASISDAAFGRFSALHNQSLLPFNCPSLALGERRRKCDSAVYQKSLAPSTFTLPSAIEGLPLAGDGVVLLFDVLAEEELYVNIKDPRIRQRQGPK